MRDVLRPVVALCVVSLAAAAMPGAAAADTPTISSSIDGTAGNNSWWRGSTHGNNVILHWTVTGNPPLTNTTGCDPAITIPGPTTGVSKTCTATNDDGTSSSARSVKIDADPPTGVSATPARAPDANGWYDHLVPLVWSGTDATSGMAGCTTSSYSGPDSANASAPGSCTDNAGNVANVPFGLKYDATDPSISVSPGRSPDFNGWYTSSVALNWTKSDATSGINAGYCSLPASYSGPDDGSATVTGSCSDNAGNSASKSFNLKYDATAPHINAGTPGRAPDSNGWYSHPVTVTWGGTDATSGIAGCTSSTYSGPDNAAASMPGGTCHDQAGNAAAGAAFHLKYDATPPHITGATLSRPPDFDGWYTHPVTITWAGTDALSGIASCTSAPFSGNASAAATATGSCHDKAGNVTSASIQLKYDATAPALSKVGVASRAGSNLVRWTSSSPNDRIVLKRWARGSKDEQVVLDGTGSRFVDTKIKSGLEYRYAIQSTDQAGNVSKTADVTGFPKVLTLQKTPYVPRAAPKPILRWGPMAGADYFHVQLFRGSTRILAAWPSKRQLGLASSWKWAGHRYTLSPGRYRWFVWGGLGKRSFARYRAMGSARFIVPSR